MSGSGAIQQFAGSTLYFRFWRMQTKFELVRQSPRGFFQGYSGVPGLLFSSVATMRRASFGKGCCKAIASSTEPARQTFYPSPVVTELCWKLGDGVKKAV